MILILTSQTGHLAKSLKTSKKFEVILPELNKDGKRYFPDGEVYARLAAAKRLKGKRVMVVHSGAPKPNEGVGELELILQILTDWKAQPIEVFFTYFPYGMQDKAFDTGETNAAENLIKKLVNYYGVKKIYIVDAHFAGKSWVKKYPISFVSAVSQLRAMAKNEFGQDTVFLSPDKGGKRRTGIAGMKKKRKNSYEVEMESAGPLKKLIKNRAVAVVDDLIETGGTLDRFYDECKKAGAKDVVALITHGVLQSGISRIKKKYSKVYLTNTINRKQANIDITSLILKTLS